MNAWSELILARLVDFYVLSAALLAVSWIATRWLLKNPAQRMTWAWGITAALLMIAAASLWPNLRQTPSQWIAQTQEWLWPEPTVVTSIDDTTPLSDAPIIPPLASNELAMTPELPAEAVEPLAQPSLVWGAIRVSLITAWGSATVLMICWLLVGALQVRRIKRRVESVPVWAHDELAKVSRGKSTPLFASQHVQTAVALGALRPTILLPAAEVHDDNQSAVRASIRHEWAHISHGDLWLHALQRFLTVLLFAHPLYWLFRKQTRADQELLADAAASGGDPLGYAETLLSWARQAAQRTPNYRFSTAESLGLTMWRDASSLQRRIEMLVEQKSTSHPRPGRFARAAIVSLLLFLGAALSTITVQSQEQGRETETPITDLTTQQSGHSDVISGKDQGGRRHVVITQMSDRLVIHVHESVLGPDLETTYAAKDAATLQKRHPEIFRLYERFTDAAKVQSQRPVIAPPPMPGKAVPTRASSGSGDGNPIFLIESTIGEVNQAAFADKALPLEEIFETKLPGKYEFAGNVIIAVCTQDEADQVRAQLDEAKALNILSRPQMLTANQQKASIRVGSELPVQGARMPPKPEMELKYYFEGIALDVSPSITTGTDPTKPTKLGLAVTAERSKRDPNSPAATVPSRRQLHFNAAVEPGKVLVVAERAPKDKVKDKNTETLYLQLRVQQATPELMRAAERKSAEAKVVEVPILPSPGFIRRNNDSPDLQALRAENAELKAQLHSFQAQQAQLMQRMERENLDRQARREPTGHADQVNSSLRDENAALKAQLQALRGQQDELQQRMEEQRRFLRPAAAAQATPEAETTLRIYRLQNMQAEKAADLVASLADENKQQLKVTKDDRTNSLIIRGDNKAHEIVTALLVQLDGESPPQANPLPQANNTPRTNIAPPGAANTPPSAELQKQLNELEVMEAEAVLATAKNKLERLQQMHKSGQVSITELSAAEYEAKAAMLQAALAKRPNDPRFQAEAQLQLAEARLDTAKKDYDRATQLSKTGSISAEEVAKLELDFRRAEIAVRRAKLHLDALPKAPPGR